MAGLVLGISPTVKARSAAAAELRDGPTACSAGNPPYPYRGFCATYNGANTFYGTYGLGFPTPTAFGLCANSAAGGGAYPAPGYKYGLGAAPAGANLSAAFRLGYALSQFESWQYFNGSVGRFSADQASVAAKLVYDATVWGRPLSGYDPGVAAAVNELLGLMNLAIGASAQPTLRASLVPSGTSFVSSATYRARVAFPGTNTPIAGVHVLLSIKGGSFDKLGGPTTVAGMTDASGNFDSQIFAAGSAPSSVEVTSLVQQGVPELSFWQPTAIVLNAQKLAAFDKPSALVRSVTYATGSNPPPAPATGKIAIIKHGDAEAYVTVAAATFAVKSGSTTVATLVVNDAGQAGPSPSLAVGSYKLVETLAPPGYQAGPDRTVTVNANATTTVSYDAANINHAIRAHIALAKADSTSGAALAGAQLGLRYDSLNSGNYDQDLGSCLTAANGSCVVASGELLPGRYEIRELAVPPGYALDPNHDRRQLMISPGEVHTVTFHDPPLLALAVEKVASRDLAIQLAGASIDLYRMDHGSWPAPDAPSDASLLEGGSWIARIDSATSATVVTDLLGGFAYCALEHRAPAGYALNPEPVCSHDLLAPADPTQPAASLVIDDDPLLTTVQAFKFNSLTPNTGIPGATYDLYVKGLGPPGTPSDTPSDAKGFAGHRWFARGMTDDQGDLRLEVPVGFTWCFHEQFAPPEYLLDPGLHCIDKVATRSSGLISIAVPETPNMVKVSAYKFNATSPYTGVPFAAYALFVKGSFPLGFSPPALPQGLEIPEGLGFWAEGMTSASGKLSFSVPAGHAWCFKEISAPTDYLLDPGLHCTGLVDKSNAPLAALAIPEVEGLATTGGNLLCAGALGLICIILGLLILRRRRSHGEVTR